MTATGHTQYRVKYYFKNKAVTQSGTTADIDHAKRLQHDAPNVYHAAQLEKVTIEKRVVGDWVEQDE